MARYFLFGTLMWDDLLLDVAGEDVGCLRARLDGWSVERAAAGDWPVLVPGGAARGYLTADLSEAARARLDWYEEAFGYVPADVTVEGPEGPVAARVYRERDGAGGSGTPWSLTDWIARHGARTRLAAAEIMRGRGRVSTDDIRARRKIIQSRAQAVVDARAYRRPATKGGELGAADVTVEALRHPYDGFHRVEEWVIDHPRFDGGRSGPIDRAISHVADAATVLPYDAVRDRVLVVEQIRVGALAKGDPQPWLLEPIAGLIDAGESAETTALRETEEEAGVKIAAQDLHFVARYYPSPGGLAQVLHSYVALCDLPDDLARLHGLAEEGEDIRAHLLRLDDLLAMIPTGEAANAPLILSAQWLALHRGGLRG
ncbi:NUDIX domain-containing protein [Jannaschia marina]|uniref:NUDIX domain-containing protein n=1 Tax=Jannaschia marina TaxID=2741674 RepID=UPI0015CB8F40|nr:NUDIX domain-containing protein [Jannaschia marina]